MRILHFINDLRVGGTENSLVNYSSDDKDNEHFIVAFGTSSAFQERLDENNVKLLKINFKESFFSSISELIKIIKKFKPDIIHSWMYHVHFISFVLSLFGYKVIWSIRNHDISRKNNGFVTFFLIKILAVVSNIYVKKIIFNSLKSKNEHCSKGFSIKKSIFIFNGYKLPEGLDSIQKEDFNSILNIISVGRYEDVKNHDLLFNCLSSLKKEGFSFKCTLVGKNFNTLNNFLISKLNNLNIFENIELFDFRKDIKIFYKKFDISILTSNFESFPNVLAESMICGVPCISTDVGEARKIISNYGYVIQKNNIEQLKNSLIDFYELKKDKEYLYFLKNNCRKHIQNNFGFDQMNKEFQKVYDI
jgi:glycosyltransferase involved in cell wall biosynthesis